MIKKLGAIERIAITVLTVAVVTGFLFSVVALYKYSVKVEVIDDIKTQEIGIKHEDIKRVKKASDVVNAKSDCDKLSSVYNSDQCEGRQDPPEADIQETATTEGTYPLGVGQGHPITGNGSMRMGGTLPDTDREQTESVQTGCTEKALIQMPDIHIGCSYECENGNWQEVCE